MSEAMSAIPGPAVSRSGRRLFLFAAILASLLTGAWFRGIITPVASAAPESSPRLAAPTAPTEQALAPHEANADADIGPGQAEPVLVSSP